MYTEETRSERDTSTTMFIVAVYNRYDMEATLMFIRRQMDKKVVVIYTMEYYSAIKKNTFESALMRWMKLESIIHSEVSQNEKHQYSVLTHIYGI